MRVGYGLIAASLVLALAVDSASSQTAEELPNPKKLGINPDIVVQPVEPAEEPQSPKPGLDTGTVVQVDEPAATDETVRPKFCKAYPWADPYYCGRRNPRYHAVMQLVPSSEPCPGFKYNSPTDPVVIEPASKGRGFYLPLPLFTNAFPGGITLQNSADNFTELGHPMSFEGLIAVRDVPSGVVIMAPRYVQGWGVFSGNLLRDASRFGVKFEVNWESQGKKCSMTGSVAGTLVRQ